ncbi:MAG: sulfate adenylyltransferase subunit CysN [Helicobacteraceae bacterium]|nr:sulfate adenylyltransferase subunit CysN [Helicobacteraceae bacterium]
MENITDIENYLKEHENKDMLRFLTCGSVDDGKSTLIGRLLYDSKMIFDDQLASAESESKKYGTTGEKIDMALLVDGLQSEREQGITIDVAYRFFATENRKFIIADTPGHEQYTRNMVTGASTADVAIILIDARKGILTQTRRHSFIVSLLGIEHVIVAINKMDLVEYSEETFNEISKAYGELATELGIKNTYYMPVSALDGDNVVDKSTNMPWFKEKPLLSLLDTMQLETSDYQLVTNFRFPVQYVNRPNLNFRGFCGTITAGSVKVGDEITILPSGKTTTVKSIVNAGDITEVDREVTTQEAYASMAITLTTQEEVDISRGDMIVHTASLPRVSNSLKVMLVWMDEKPMDTQRTYDMKVATTVVSGVFEHINYRVDVNTYKRTKVETLELNDIASCKMLLTRPIAADSYKTNKQTGSFIVVDRVSNNTVGAGMIVDVSKRESENIREENIFNIWNDKKQIIHNNNEKYIKFRERDILFLSVGQNIGYEQYGKGDEFLRPVLVYKKFNSRTFLGIPLSSKEKSGSYYFSFNYTKDTISTANFSQMKTFDIKRVKYRSGYIKAPEFEKLSKKLIKLLEITP